MKKKIIIFVLIFLPCSFAFSKEISSIANKTDYEIPYEQSIICEDELHIGFNWENRKFVRSKYKNVKVIFKKINHNLDKSHRFCKILMKKQKDFVENDYIFLKRCYSTQRFGSESYPSICSEFYKGKKKSKLVSITCGEYKFDPDGLFLKKPSSANVNGDVDYKDSFSISHGKCARF